MEEWRESTVHRWEAERASRPTANELENWERTVAEIRSRYKLAEDHKDRAELCHRLAISYIKMENYDEALKWVELGLAEGSEDLVHELREDMALVLYLQDRKEEAMTILDELAQKHPLIPNVNHPKRIAPRVAEEAILNLICPHCDSEVPYGQLRCSGCGAKVNDRFTLVHSTKDGRKVHVKEELETHRVKEFSLFLTDFIVDYDDPKNFLTAHRVRFMGGEMTTITEKGWYIWTGLFLLAFFYLVFGILVWSLLSIASPPGPFLGVTVMAAAILLPLTIFYLYVIFPNFLGNAIDYPILRG